ncbi:hypothetical protein LPN04_29820 [Rugamonas sp. A1-17]|nr:hypothetical protein [Rugamonas sp. A1-17]
MQTDPQSTATVDVDASLARAYNATLPTAEQQLIYEHLTSLLPQLSEPNSYIAPCREAVRVMEARFAGQKKWHEKPLGAVTLMVVGGFIGGLLVLFVGYKLRINGTDAPHSPSPALTPTASKP